MMQLRLFRPAQQRVVSDKDLLRRINGRFYTHKFISTHLISAVLETFAGSGSDSISVVEPFCGDGRLICGLLRAASRLSNLASSVWQIDLWDNDPFALRAARESVDVAASECGIKARVKTREGNSFVIAPAYFGKFSICVTNPPWEILKPDRREMSSLQETEKLEYIEVLKEQDAIVTDLYRVSNPSRRFSGWGTNLARTGVELSLRLINEEGVCGFVSPASLLADQRSEQLRNWLFSEHEVRDLAYYPAEARLFDRVDQPSITVVALRSRYRENIPPVLSRYNAKLEKSLVKIPLSEWKDLATQGYVVPLQFGTSLIGLLKKWKTLPTVLDLEKDALQPLWAGRELDETDHRQYLADRGEYLFVKGKVIRRFGIAEHPVNYIKVGGPRIPKSAGFHRLVWRDVARLNQKRRMHATIIPPRWVTGNSLNVAYFRDADIVRLKALLAVFNSLMFEAQVRVLSATGHISLGTVRRVHVPDLSDAKIVNRLAGLTDQCLAGDSLAKTRVEVAVSRFYGVDKTAFEQIAKCFDKVDPMELSTLLGCPEWKI